ncbi:MAG: hypothetical protein AAF685_10180 [Cyanobacteria bacterium P01_C01_bin.89]
MNQLWINCGSTPMLHIEMPYIEMPHMKGGAIAIINISLSLISQSSP